MAQSIHYISRKVIGLIATEIEMPRDIFNFSGQTGMDTFAIEPEKMSIDFERYDDLAVHGLRLALESVRRHAD